MGGPNAFRILCSVQKLELSTSQINHGMGNLNFCLAFGGPLAAIIGENSERCRNV